MADYKELTDAEQRQQVKNQRRALESEHFALTLGKVASAPTGGGNQVADERLAELESGLAELDQIEAGLAEEPAE